MHSYAAYGLDIQSAFSLPELRDAESTDAADIVIRRETLDPNPLESTSRAPNRVIDVGSGHCTLRYEDIGTFRVESGSRILVDPLSEDIHTTMVFRRLLEGQILGLLCHQRGDLVLHGSVIGIDGNAVAFLGVSTIGKSTTAAACHLAGHALLDDDVVVVRSVDGAVMAMPGVPQMKLEPATATALDVDYDDVRDETVDSQSGKAYYNTPPAEGAEPLPLARCYLLNDGDGVSIEPVPAHQRVLELVSSTYTAGLLADTDAMETNFQACSRVAESIAVKMLRRPIDFDALSAVVEAVERDLRAV